MDKIYYVNAQACYLPASKTKNKEGKPELQIVIPFNRPENDREFYKERRQIETAFKALKSGGFNIEDTHLADLNALNNFFRRLCRLFCGRIPLEFTSTKMSNQ